MQGDIREYLEEKRSIIDAYLKSYCESSIEPSVLQESIRYSLLAGGKRMRPILAMASYEACGGRADDILPQAAALELIHTYSLIHDDLPAMDDDDMRRGRPSNHKVFGEAMAILAGDGLLTEAFFMMTKTGGNHRRSPVKVPESENAVAFSARIPCHRLMILLREIAEAAGIRGMVGGQAQDILSENAPPDGHVLDFIHMHKTAALIRAAARMGPILAGSGKKTLRALSRYGERIGLAFQVVDDILNEEGTAIELGKPTGSDRMKRKMTYPFVYGLEGAKKRRDQLLTEAVQALEDFSGEADVLREMAYYIVMRRT